MLEFFSNNPMIALFLYCLCAPPGLLSLVVVWLVAKKYDLTNPLRPAAASQKVNEDV